MALERIASPSDSIDDHPYHPLELEYRGILLGETDRRIQRLASLAPSAEHTLEEKILHYSDEPSSAFRTNHYVFITRSYGLLMILSGIASPITYFASNDEKAKGFGVALGVLAMLLLLFLAAAKCGAVRRKRELRTNGFFDRDEEKVIPLTLQEATQVQTTLDYAGLSDIKINIESDGDQIKRASRAFALMQKEISLAAKYNRQLKTALFKALPAPMPKVCKELVFDYAIEDPTKNRNFLNN